MASRVLRGAQWVLGFTVVFFVVRHVARNWSQIEQARLAWTLRPGYLLLSAALVWAMYALLISAWRAMLSGWGQPIDGWNAARIWTVSSLGKYIPGKVWAIAGMAVMSQRAGVAAWAATGSAILLQVLAVGTGTAIVGAAGNAALQARWPGAGMGMALLGAASVVATAVLLWPAAVRALLQLASGGRIVASVPGRAGVLFGIAANFIAWIGYGAALWLLARGLLPAAPLTFSVAAGAFAASYLAGLLILVAPGGLGVRESVLIVMLEPSVGLAAAGAIAVASRLLLTITELGAAAPFLLFARERTRVAT